MKASLTAVAETLGGLSTTDATSRRACMDRFEEWAKDGLPEGAGRLVLDYAARSFPAVDDYPQAPNEQLLSVLWNGKTSVAAADVEASFPRLSEECRASASRLLSELALGPRPKHSREF